jgi:tyrosine-protein kinase Etk/Wzc
MTLLDMNSTPEMSSIAERIAAAARANLLALTLVPVLCGTTGYLIAKFAIAPVYESSAQILPPQGSGGSSSLLAAASTLGSVAGINSSAFKNPADQWVGIMKSRTVADAIIVARGLQARYQTNTLQAARSILASNTKIALTKEGIISVSVEDESSELAAAISNEYVRQLQLASKKLAVTDAGQRRNYFEALLNDAKRRSVDAEIRLRSAGVAESNLKLSPDKVALEIAQLKTQIAAIRIKLSAARLYATDLSQEVRTLRAQEASLSSMLKAIEAPDARAFAGNGQDYVGLLREFKQSEALLDAYTRQYELARADEAREGATVQVIDTAIPSEIPSKPRKLIWAGAMGMLGLLAVSALVAIRANRVRA